MGYIEGLLGGFSARKREVEVENLRAAERAGDREARIYDALLSSPDPEIQALAASGLIESAQPKRRKKGIRGWIGEMETSPTFGRLQSLIETPVETDPGAPGLPSRQLQPVVTQPPAEAPAGMPAQSLTEPGAAPAPALTYRYANVPGPAVGRPPSFGPRRVFPTAEDTAVAGARGKARGDVEGEVAGLIASGIPEAEARELIKEDYRRRATVGTQSIAGELPDGTPAFGVFDRTRGQYLDPASGQPLTGFRPRTTSASVSLGQYAERAAGELGYSNAAAARAAGPDAMRRVNERAAQLQAETAGQTVTARGAAGAQVPLTSQQRFQATTSLMDDWRKAEAPQREMARQYQLMQTGLQRFYEGDKIGGSQAVLVTFQKILDPTSVVRESEYARTGEGLGLLQRVQGQYQRLLRGGAGVPDQELAAMVETANQFLQGLTTWNALEQQRIGTLAAEYGIPPTLIFGDPSAIGTPPPAGGAAAPAPTPATPRTRKDAATGNWVIDLP